MSTLKILIFAVYEMVGIDSSLAQIILKKLFKMGPGVVGWCEGAG